jgi:hypothetical protein
MAMLRRALTYPQTSEYALPHHCRQGGEFLQQNYGFYTEERTSAAATREKIMKF